jgi:tetratricopeptide (TPR) repeat protein
MSMDLKEEGNAHFKKGEFELAYSCYTKAIAAQPLSCVLYGNRAACALALRRFREAELDCGIAITLDKSFGKGFFRRAQARLELGRLELAKLDAQEALTLVPGKATAHLLAEIESKMKNQAVKATVESVVEAKEEVSNKSRKVNPEVEPAVVNAKMAKLSAETTTEVENNKSTTSEKTSFEAKPKVTFSDIEAMVMRDLKGDDETVQNDVDVKWNAPKTAYELENTLSHIGSDSSKLCSYLSLITPKSLPNIVGISFSEEMLCLFCKAFENLKFDPNLAVELLKSMLHAPRCELVIDFLSDETKKRFEELFRRWGNNVDCTELLRFVK